MTTEHPDRSAETTAGSCPFSKNVLGGATLADPEIQANPYAFFRAMRTQDPVYYDEKIAMYLVSRFDDVETVLRDDKVYSCEQLDLVWESLAKVVMLLVHCDDPKVFVEELLAEDGSIFSVIFPKPHPPMY